MSLPNRDNFVPNAINKPSDIEARYQSLFEDASLGIALARATDLRFLQVNPAFCRLLGYSAEELLAIHSCRTITFDEDRAHEEELMIPVLAGQSNGYRMEKRYVRKDGSLVWAMLTTSFVRNADGSPRDVFGIVEDITARKARDERQERTEIELRQSQASLLLAQRLSHSGSWSHDPSTGRSIWSAEMFSLFGFDHGGTPPRLEEILARCSDSEAARLVAVNQAAIEQGIPYAIDFCLRLPNGKSRHLHIVAEVERDATRVMCLYGIVLDITQRKEHEEEVCRLNAALEQRVAERTAQLEETNLALVREVAERMNAEHSIRERERQLQALADNTTTILARVNADLRYVFCNSELAKRFSWTPAEMVGKTLPEVYGDGYDTIMRPRVERVFAGHEVVFDSLFTYPDLGPRNMHVSYRPEFDALGKVKSFVISAMDLTEQRQAEERALRSAQRLERVFESISDGFLVLDPDWRIAAMNGEAERLLARPRRELLGHVIWELFHERVNGRFWRRCHEAVDTQSTVTFETEFSELSLWVEMRIFPSSEGLSLYFRDVTQAHKDAQQLRLLDLAIHSSNNGILVTDARQADQPIVYVNPAFEQMSGYTQQEIFGKNCRILQCAATDPVELDVLRTAIRNGDNAHVCLQNVRKDGTLFWNDIRISPVRDENGMLTHFVGIQTDVSARREADEQFHLLNSERQRLADNLRLLLESTEEGIYGIDLDGRCTFVNAAAAQMLGYAPEDLHGKHLHPLIHHRRPDGSEYSQSLWPVLKTLTAGESCSIDTEVFWRKDGTPVPVAYLSHPMKTSEGVVGAVVTFRDITERQAVERERERLLAEAIDRADRDPLTGLLNHRAFQKRLSEEADRAQRTGEHLGVAVIDLNNFKFFNDAYGHLAGDEVLISISHALQSVCRSYDTLARFGGDEFAILLPGVDPADRQKIVERLVASVAKVSYLPAGYTVAIPLSISAGLAFFPAGVATRTEVLAAADEDLRFAKTGGDQSGEAAIRLRHELLEMTKGYEMLNALVTAVDNKDRYTRKHSEDVMYHSLKIAQELGWDEAQQRVIAIAALLHDVGKIGVPDKILRKPGSLTPDESDLMKQHPDMGAVIVAAVPGFENTLEAIRHHHEQWNGSGYPHGLAGDAIPWIARIMAVADAFSAMTTNRPYRNGMPDEAALEILRRGAGEQWDAACVAAFLKARQTAASLILVV